MDQTTAKTRRGIPRWSEASRNEWGNWTWQLRGAIRNVSELNDILATFTDHRVRDSSLVQKVVSDGFSFKVTPHMVLNLKRALEDGVAGAWQSFVTAFVPFEEEYPRVEGANGTDCIGEELPAANPVKAITGFYRNRVLFRVTSMCAAYCRYCFRRRMLGDGMGAWNEAEIQEGIAYVAGNPHIEEVILSGGDPLILSDDRLARVLTDLRGINHIRRLRIDTKILTMLPQRITSDLLNIFREVQPFYLIGHFSHLSELSNETRDACDRLCDAGIPVRSHTPLLKGINDDEHSLVDLMEALVDCRVQPYYLIQFIPTKWTQHFRVSLARGLELTRYLQKECGGLATPTYIVYLPKAGGKVPVSAPYLIERRPDGYVFESQDGRQILYPEPEQPHSGETD